MNDWLTRVSAASGIPSEIFILGFIAFFLLIVLVIGLIYCLIRLKSISANTLQTVAQARMAWREDLGAAVTQSKDLIADRMKPNFMETERTLERSFQDVSAGIRSETFASLKAVQDTLNHSLTRNDEQISSVNKRFEELSRSIREEIAESGKVVQSTLNQSLIRNDEQIKSLNERFEELSKTLRGEIFSNLKAVQDTLNQSLTRNDEQLRGVNQRFETLSSTLNTSLNELRKHFAFQLDIRHIAVYFMNIIKAAAVYIFIWKIVQQIMQGKKIQFLVQDGCTLRAYSLQIFYVTRSDIEHFKLRLPLFSNQKGWLI